MATKKKHFTIGEDTTIARAYINCSESATTGTDMSSLEFWSKIATSFNSLRQSEAKENEAIVIREHGSLKARWKKVMPKISQWAAIYNDALKNRKSGENDEQVLANAHSVFETRYKSRFQHIDCYHVMKNSPKFGTTWGRKEDESSVFTNVGSTASRPGGQKQAKRKEREAGKALAMVEKKMKLHENMVDAAQKVDSKLGSIANAEQCRMLFDMYTMVGDGDNAMVMLTNLRKNFDDFQVLLNRSGNSSIPNDIAVGGNTSNSTVDSSGSSNGLNDAAAGGPM